MKIPFMTTVVAILLSACNPAKNDMVNVTAASSLRTAPQVFVINAQRNIHASVYVVGEVVMVRAGNQPEQRLSSANPSLYPAYKPVFFRTHDLNRDGFNEIAVLATVSFGAVDLCYDVFHYNPVTGKFVRKVENFYCTHG